RTSFLWFLAFFVFALELGP
ncbi:hypothetical protein CCACVL1_00564, partial [Corchorus capsularis]